MTDDHHINDQPEPAQPDAAARDDDETLAVFVGRRPQSEQRDPYDLEWLFLCWAWEAGFRDWNSAVRTLARVLRGVERIGFIERRTIRRPGRKPHHGFVITEDGMEGLKALSGEWLSRL